MARVLVIDDDAAVRTAIGHVLARLGHAMVEAGEGNEAIRQLKDAPPDLIITDIIMPGREGIETIMVVRSLLPEVPIIAMSGGGSFGGSAYLQVAERLGASATIMKPFKIHELQEQVEALLPQDVPAEG